MRMDDRGMDLKPEKPLEKCNPTNVVLKSCSGNSTSVRFIHQRFCSKSVCVQTGFCCQFTMDFTPATLKRVTSTVKICSRNWHNVDFKICTAGSFPCNIFPQQVDDIFKVSSTCLLLYSAADFTHSDLQVTSVAFSSCVNLPLILFLFMLNKCHFSQINTRKNNSHICFYL